MAGNNSIVVYGVGGSGKTALRLQLEKECQPNKQGKQKLLVRWEPNLPSRAEESSLEVTLRQTDDLLDQIGDTILNFIKNSPDSYSQIPQWAKNHIIWYLHKCIQGSLATRLGPIISNSSPEAQQQLLDIQNAIFEDIRRNPGPKDFLSSLLLG